MTRILIIAAILFLSGTASAEAPVAMYVFPAGGQRGTTVEVKVGGLFLYDRCGFELLGSGITAPTELKRTTTLWLEGPVLPLPDSQRQEDYPRDMAGSVKIAADAPLGIRSWRVWTSQGVTPARRFVVGDLPEVLEQEIQGTPLPRRVTLPVTANGRIFPQEDVDVWAFELRKGQIVTAAVEAARLGSPLDSRIEVRDPDGRVLAENDDGSTSADSFLRFTAARDGVYQVRIHDIAFKGSQAHVYRLTLTGDQLKDGTAGSKDAAQKPAVPAAPDFQLKFGLDALTLPRGGQITLPVTVEAVGGFRQPIALSVEGLPADVTVTGTALAAGQASGTLTFKATATTKISSVPLTLQGKAKIGEKETTRLAVSTLEPGLTTVRLAVALPTPFKVAGKYEMGWASRGTVGKRIYTIERNGFTGPLTVSLADRQARHLQGATGPTITVPASATQLEYAVTLPPWMEIGRTCRVCVMAVGVITEPDGSKHAVSFSSINQNEQYVAVIEAGQLELATERGSLRAEAGKSVAVPVKVTRGKSLEGAVRVELIAPGHVRGVSAAAVEIAAGQSTGILTIRFEAEKPGPFNMPLTLRATLNGKAGPVTAEAKLDVGE